MSTSDDEENKDMDDIFRMSAVVKKSKLNMENIKKNKNKENLKEGDSKEEKGDNDKKD